MTQPQLDPAELVAAMPDIARALLGEPNRHHSRATELRYGTNGSLSIDLAKGVFHDKEAGVGGGVIQVPAMNLVMAVPVKAAAGTSALMVGITAVASSFVFYADNKMDPGIVLPAIIGIIAGAQTGSRLTRKVRTDRLVIIFVLVLLYLSFRLIMKAFEIDLPSL